MIVLDRASPSAAARIISDRAFAEPGPIDIKDVEPSPDGTRFIFAMRAPEIEDADEEDQPRWNIWEYNTRSLRLRRIIDSDISAEEG